MAIMFPRKCTLQFEFDKSTRNVQPSSVEVHDWIDEVFGITSDQVHTAYYDMEEYIFYVKLLNPVLLHKILLKHGGSAEFRHRDSSVSTVLISNAGIEYKNVRVFNLPPEVENCYLKDFLSKYGDVKHIRNERWSSQHKLQCYSGVRSVEMNVKENIPSHIVVCGYKAHVTYSGQVGTCYICNETGHMRQNCPRRMFVLKNSLQQRKKLTLADLVTRTPELNDAETTPSVSTQDILTVGAAEFPPLPQKVLTEQAPLKNATPVSTQTIKNKRRRTCDESSPDEASSHVEQDIREDAAIVASDVPPPNIEPVDEEFPVPSLVNASTTPEPQPEEERPMPVFQSQVQERQQVEPGCNPTPSKQEAVESASKHPDRGQHSFHNKQVAEESVDKQAESESDGGSSALSNLELPEAKERVAAEAEMDLDVCQDPPTPPSAAGYKKSGRRKNKIQAKLNVVRKKNKNKASTSQDHKMKVIGDKIASTMDWYKDKQV